jgi:hypothetical protein
MTERGGTKGHGGLARGGRPTQVRRRGEVDDRRLVCTLWIFSIAFPFRVRLARWSPACFAAARGCLPSEHFRAVRQLDPFGVTGVI